MPSDSLPLQEDDRAAAGPPHPGVLPKPSDTAKASTPETHSSNAEGSKAIEIQQQMLDVLNRMYREMQGQEHEEGTRRGVSRGTSNAPFRKTCFGIPKQRFDQGQQSTTGNEDYEQMFPEDAYGEEAGPSARIFRVYNEEATVYDNDMVGKASDSSDVLLVFAGLFSAVLTTFVVQTSQALETDKLAISNSLLSELIQLQRAQANGTSLEDVHNAFTETTPTSNDVWVNGLWFTSLTLSLATALFAVLTKQWLRQYVTSMSGTIRDRSLIRQFRFAGIKKWHVIGIIGLLPVLLHLALGIFLAGLIIFLLPRCLPLAYIVGSITIIMYCLYFISNLIPIFDMQCPFRTPLSDILNFMRYWCKAVYIFTRTCFGRSIIVMLPKPMRYQFRATFTFILACFEPVNAKCEYIRHVLAQVRREIPVISLPVFETLREREHAYVQEKSVTGSLSLDVIAWLMKASSNPSVHSVAVQGVGGLPPSQRDKVKSSIKPSLKFIEKLVRECIDEGDKVICLPQFTRRLERILRMCPIIFARDRHPGIRRRTFWRSIYLAFRELGDTKGMASALPMALRDPNARHVALVREIQDGIDADEHLDLLTRLIRDSPLLSPKAWINLFLEVPSRSISKLDLFDICAKALEEISGWKGPTWDGVTSSDPVSVSIALSRDPDIILWVLREYNPFLDSSLDGPSSSSLPPPDSLRLRALLTLHRFLEKSQTTAVQSSSGKKRGSLLRLFESTWKGISFVIEQDHTMNDCSAVFQAANLCIVESSLLMGNEWMTSVTDELKKYAVAVLRSCRIACVHAGNIFGHHVVCDWRWKVLLDRVTEDLTFVNSGETVAVPMYSLRLWRAALDYGVQDAYSRFVSAYFLRRNDTYSTQSVVRSFILGLARQRQSTPWSLCPSPKPEWLLECLEYLHAPDNLLSACEALANHRDASPEDFLTLARLEPANNAWTLCREELWQWDPVWSPDYDRLQEGLEALDSFFESRQHQEFLYRLSSVAVLFCIPTHAAVDAGNLQEDTCESQSAAAHGPLSGLQDIFEQHPVSQGLEVGTPELSGHIQLYDHAVQVGEPVVNSQPAVTGDSLV